MNKSARQRLWHTLRLWLIPNSYHRAEYIKKHKLFHSIGDGCTVMERKVPLYGNLISIGNNVHLAAKVSLIPHDAIHLCLNVFLGGDDIQYKEKIGCIEIGDNVFIGSNKTILYDVKIGSNVIIGAGSLVNKDIPDNSVAVGNPCKVIGKFDEFVKKRQSERTYPNEFKPIGHIISKEFEECFWDDFDARHH